MGCEGELNRDKLKKKKNFLVSKFQSWDRWLPIAGDLKRPNPRF